jgi:hypothetical protein
VEISLSDCGLWLLASGVAGKATSVFLSQEEKTMLRRILTTTALTLAAVVSTVQAADAPKSAATVKGRDWTKIDTNKDGYIQPEEMEKWLAENPGPEKK